MRQVTHRTVKVMFVAAVATALVLACDIGGGGGGGGGTGGTSPTSDFTQISGSGTITIQVDGANADHNGASLMYGAAGIPFGQGERSGNNTVISSDTVAVTIQHPDSSDFVFTGGDTIAGVGAIIDVNANDRADDGDWYAERLNLTVSGDRAVIFEY